MAPLRATRNCAARFMSLSLCCTAVWRRHNKLCSSLSTIASCNVCRLYVPEDARPTGTDQKPVPRFFPAFGWHDARDLYSSRIFRKHGPIVLACLHLFVFGGAAATVAVEWAGGSSVAPYDDYGAYLTNWCAPKPLGQPMTSQRIVR